jgi:CHAT domain-containing protein/tetratricopeptide (TPR) repeat protein
MSSRKPARIAANRRLGASGRSVSSPLPWLLCLTLWAIAPFSSLLVPSPSWAQAATTHQQDADRLYLEGLKRFNAEQLPGAIEAWEQALQGYRQRGDRPGEGKTLHELGFAYYWLEDFEKAISAYSQALAIARALGDRSREAQILAQMGDVYFYQKRYEQALQASTASLPLIREGSDRQRLWLVLNRLGEIHFALKQDEAALPYYQQARDLALQISDPQLAQTALVSLGLIYLRQGNYPQVISTLQPALKLKQASAEQGQEDLLQMIGFSYYWLNDYAQAIDTYEQGLVEARKHANAKTELLLLSGLGDVYFYVGNLDKSREFHEQSLTLARKLGNRSAETVALISLGSAAYQSNNIPQMVQFYQQGLGLARQNQLANLEANALSGLGRAYLEQQKTASARVAFQQSLKIYRQIGNRYNEGVMLRALAELALTAQDYPQAIAQFQASVTLSETSQELYGAAQSLTGLGLALYKAGQLAAAETQLRQAIERNEAIRQKLGQKDDLKVALFDTQTSPYQALQVVLVAQGKSDAALEVAERARARAFVEQLQSRQVSTASLSPEPLTLGAIRQFAQTQEATLVEYSIINQQLYIWVISPQGTVTFRKSSLPASQTNLDEMVTASRSALGVRSARGGLALVAVKPDGIHQPQEQRQRQDQWLQMLYQVLVQPISDRLPTDPDAPVIFIPQGSLFFVPFAALQDAQGRALIEKHTLLTAPAIQVLDLLQQPTVARTRGLAPSASLVAGNPTMPSVVLTPGEPPEPLLSLPGAEQEAQAIAQLLDTQALIGPSATETAIVQRLPQAKVVHLATHGLLDDGASWGLPGAIALAPSRQDDGLLTAEEILKLHLDADLIVLSACDTGRGRITGDGVIGLSRSLLTAGARNVLVSLWAVPDTPTTSLMTEFYRQITAGQGKAQALRQAMLALKKQEPNPLAWSAFTLIGPVN